MSLVNIAFLILGLIVLVIGADGLVRGASRLAALAGIPPLIIGLTIVAFGTSAPELAVSVTSALNGQPDLTLGNVVGSNIFNIVAVLGLSTLFSPAGIEVAGEAQRFDIPVMTAVAVACLPIFFTGNVIARWEGFLFLGYYVAYTIYLVLVATQSPSQAAFGTAMLWFVVPLTLVTLGITLWRTLHNAPAASAAS